MNNAVYTLKKKKDTDEYHLFQAEPVGERCTPEQNSICKKMKNSEFEEIFFACKDENSARTECAKKGRVVCGTCVSHLYTTYK